jgi:alkylation response protein AidB-like acyl-CoA dehydrogenase
VHHPEHGWLAFVFPPEHGTLLGVTLVKHSALCEYFAGALPPSTVVVN